MTKSRVLICRIHPPLTKVLTLLMLASVLVGVRSAHGQAVKETTITHLREARTGEVPTEV